VPGHIAGHQGRQHASCAPPLFLPTTGPFFRLRLRLAVHLVQPLRRLNDQRAVNVRPQPRFCHLLGGSSRKWATSRRSVSFEGLEGALWSAGFPYTRSGRAGEASDVQRAPGRVVAAPATYGRSSGAAGRSYFRYVMAFTSDARKLSSPANTALIGAG